MTSEVPFSSRLYLVSRDTRSFSPLHRHCFLVYLTNSPADSRVESSQGRNHSGGKTTRTRQKFRLSDTAPSSVRLPSHGQQDFPPSGWPNPSAAPFAFQSEARCLCFLLRTRWQAMIFLAAGHIFDLPTDIRTAGIDLVALSVKIRRRCCCWQWRQRQLGSHRVGGTEAEHIAGTAQTEPTY
jgi:hypothetical protein